MTLSEPSVTNRLERRFTSLVQYLPASRPFVAPEALERTRGERFRLRLGANESAWGCSPVVRAATCEVVKEVNHYCDPEGLELRTLIAAELDCAVENVCLGEGIDGLLGLMIRLFVEPGEHVVTSNGTYPTLLYHCHGFGAAVEQVPYRDGRPDLRALSAAAHSCDAKLVYLANPDNPSGTLAPRDEVGTLVATLPCRCVLLLDEAYADFVDEDDLPRIDCKRVPVVRLRTFSKAHGLAGLRVGFTVAPAEISAGMEKIRSHFGVNLVGQRLCAVSMRDKAFLDAVVREVEQGRREYTAIGKSIGLRPLPSSTNFVTFDTGSVDASIAWVNALIAEGVFIRRPAVGSLARCIRITVGTAEDRTALKDVMERVALCLPRLVRAQTLEQRGVRAGTIDMRK